MFEVAAANHRSDVTGVRIERDESAYQPLVELVTSDPSGMVRATALWYLQHYPRQEVWDLAVKTLDRYDIKYHITEIVPYIQKLNEADMCPMEKLSINKEPEEFYQVMKDTIK